MPAATTVIVAGAARSGTSAMASAIAAALGTSVIEAGATLGTIAAIADAEDTAEQALKAVAAILPSAPMAWDGAVGPVLDALLAGLTPPMVLRVADVLPDAPCLRALPVLADALPEARVVYVGRDGVDFVASRRRALPEVSFVTHCMLWAEACRQWAATAELLGPRALALSRESLVGEPDATVARLFDFLGWPSEQAVRFRRFLAGQSIGRTAMTRARLDFVDVGWTLAEKLVFAELCGDQMGQAGRPLDLDRAIRKRPLRLDEVIAAGETHFVGTAGAVESSNRSAGISVEWPAASGTGVLVLPALATQGRHRLDLSIAPRTSRAAPLALRIDVVESLSRRRRASLDGRLDQHDSLSLSTRLEPTGELVDIVFSARPGPGADRFGFRLLQGALSL